MGGLARPRPLAVSACPPLPPAPPGPRPPGTGRSRPVPSRATASSVPASAAGSAGSAVSPSWGSRRTGVGSDSSNGSIACGSAPASSSLSRCRTRVPRSAESSSRMCSSGMRLIRSRRPSSWRTNGIAAWSARTVSVLSALPPITLTQTFAWRRSGAVSTSVMVANPIRGSAISLDRSAPISWRRSSSTRSVRWLMGASASAGDPAAGLVREALDDVALLEVVVARRGRCRTRSSGRPRARRPGSDAASRSCRSR